MRVFIIGLLCFLLCGCISGRVSTENFSAAAKDAQFTIVQRDSLSLTDRNISKLIESKMVERGFVKASSSESANIAVLYKYSIGSGSTEISSSLNYATGMTSVQSNTSYPRLFELALIDIAKSKTLSNPEILWQGEIYSNGSTSNISLLAPYFIDVLFENYGITITNQKFYKVR